eukprot:9134223-Karenia_brevis.AAC.1
MESTGSSSSETVCRGSEEQHVPSMSVAKAETWLKTVYALVACLSMENTTKVRHALQKRIKDLENLIQKYMTALFVDGYSLEDVCRHLRGCNMTFGQSRTWHGYADIAWCRFQFVDLRGRRQEEGARRLQGNSVLA